MNALRVENLSQNYGGLRVLEDISFSIDPGERVGLIGPNGAGKTTLINVLTGLLPSIAGRIFILGQDVTDMPPHRRVSRGLARSFQINTLFTNLSLLNNILLAVQGTKPSRFRMLRPLTAYKDVNAKAKELLGSMDLWEKRDDLISSLSHGEQRLVEILMAIATKPKILLLDEPSSGLTRAETANLSDMLRNVMEETTVFFCAHDLDLIFSMADRVVVLYYGKIIAQGTPEVIKAHPKVKEIYLGAQV